MSEFLANLVRAGAGIAPAPPLAPPWRASLAPPSVHAAPERAGDEQERGGTPSESDPLAPEISIAPPTPVLRPMGAAAPAEPASAPASKPASPTRRTPQASPRVPEPKPAPGPETTADASVAKVAAPEPPPEPPGRPRRAARPLVAAAAPDAGPSESVTNDKPPAASAARPIATPGSASAHPPALTSARSTPSPAETRRLTAAATGHSPTAREPRPAVVSVPEPETRAGAGRHNDEPAAPRRVPAHATPARTVADVDVRSRSGRTVTRDGAPPEPRGAARPSAPPVPVQSSVPPLAAPASREPEARKIQVRIGRVDVRAAAPPPRTTASAPPGPRGFSEYALARSHLDRSWY